MVHDRRMVAAAVLVGLLGNSTWAEIMEVKTEVDYDREVKQSKGPVVVKFHADWCGACKGVAKPYKDLSNDPELKNVKFVSVDIDKVRPKGEKLGGVPAVFYFQDGQKVHDKLGGGRTFANDVRKDIESKLVITQVEATPAVEDAVEEEVITDIPVVSSGAMPAEQYDMPLYSGGQYDQSPYVDDWQEQARQWEEDAYPPVASRYAPVPPGGRALQYEEEAVAGPGYGYDEVMFEEEPYMPSDFGEEEGMPEYGYTPPPPAPYRMPARGGEDGLYPPLQPEQMPMADMAPQMPAPAPEQTGILAKVTSLVHGAVDLVADVLSAIWNAIMGLLGR